MGRSRNILLSVLIMLTVVGTVSQAEIPQVISYQGKVTDTSGNSVADGSYTMRFRIYNVSAGGSPLWDSGNRSISVAGGVFSVLLGESPQPTILLDFSADYWLLVTFLGVDQTPRQRMASVGYAYMASGLVPGTEVEGSVTSGTGAAIQGTNTATTGSAFGVCGLTSSTGGTGVLGGAFATTGTSYGVYGVNPSNSGYGVFGIASASTGSVYGVHGMAFSTAGYGVYGYASATTGTSYGVYGKAASTSGTGVYGYATAASGFAYGVTGRSDATAGRGVYGWTNATTGTTYGVYGDCISPSGYGGYFSGRLLALASLNDWATPANHVGQIYNTSTGTSPDVLALKVGYTGNPGSSINYITFFKGNDAAVGAIEGDGAGGVTLRSGSGDFAEYLPKMDAGGALEPGDVVGVFDGKVTKRTDGASQVMVVSTRPIVVGNSPGEEKAAEYARVAFIGQVEVKVRGPVQAGDLLMPSGMDDGTAVAVSRDEVNAEQFRQVFGQAWEGSDDGGVKLVRAAVCLVQHDPNVARLESENRELREANSSLRAAIVDLQARVSVLEQ